MSQTDSSTNSSLSTQEMSFSSGIGKELDSTSTTPVASPNRSPPPLSRLNLNLTTDGLLPPEDIGKVYNESALSKDEKRRLLMSVYKYAQATPFGEDSLKTVRRICNEHIVRNIKFISGEFLNDMTKSQKIKALGFGTVYQPDFSDESPKLWNDIINRMPNCSSMSLQMKAVTWMGILPTVKKTIRGYRNNVQSKMKGKISNKDSLIHALQTINTQGFEASYTGDDLNLLLGLKTIQALAEGFREDNLMKIRDKKSTDVFRAFVHYFLQHTIPKADWISARSSDLISDIFTPVDEGFAILLIINHWNEWKHLAEGNVIDRRKRLTRYTHCLKSVSIEDDELLFAKETRNYLTGQGLTSKIPSSVSLVNSTGTIAVPKSRTGEDDDDGNNSVLSSSNTSAVTTTTASTNSSSPRSTKSKDTLRLLQVSGTSDNKREKKKTRSTAKVKGWSNEGLRKFSEICRHINAIRREEEQKNMERSLLTEYKKMDEEGGEELGRKRRRMEEHELDVLEEEPFNMYAV